MTGTRWPLCWTSVRRWWWQWVLLCLTVMLSVSLTMFLMSSQSWNLEAARLLQKRFHCWSLLTQNPTQKSKQRHCREGWRLLLLYKWHEECVYRRRRAGNSAHNNVDFGLVMTSRRDYIFICTILLNFYLFFVLSQKLFRPIWPFSVTFPFPVPTIVLVYETIDKYVMWRRCLKKVKRSPCKSWSKNSFHVWYHSHGPWTIIVINGFLTNRLLFNGAENTNFSC